MSTITDYIIDQSLLNSPLKRIHLLKSSQIRPLQLMDEFHSLKRNVQFISLDNLAKDMMNSLPKTLDSFLTTGFDVVLTIQSIDTLNHYMDLLTDWKFRMEEKREMTAGEAKTGLLFLLIHTIDSSNYPARLQQLIDSEFQTEKEEEKL